MTDETSALVEETVLAPEPEPIPLPEDLPLWEEEQETTEGAPAPRFAIQNPKDATRIMARLRYFTQQKQVFTEPFDDEIRRLEAELAQLREGKAKVEAGWDNRAAWYHSSLEVWTHQLNAADPSVKSVKLPYGTCKVRAQQPEWAYDEGALVEWLKANRPELVRTKFEPIKTDLKKLVKVDGSAVHDPETGETIPGVTVTERPPKFELEVTL